MIDHLFPRFHVRPPTGYLNDPNGPILLDGLLHLYFQYRTTVDLAAPVLWAHATSRDFVTWAYHRPAMAPHPVLGDRDGCWSGNSVVDGTGAVKAFYSGLVDAEPLQRTLVAVSVDGGFSFGPPRQIVPAPAAAEGVRFLRDPFVWREGSSWRMVLGAGTEDERAMIRLYGSSDLEHWTYIGPWAQLPRTRTTAWDSGAMWECPQVVSLDGVLVALVGSWSPETGVMQVFSVPLPRQEDGPDIDASTLRLLDHGPNFYAASALRGEQRTVVWGWATEGRTMDWCQEEGWAGMLTLPRSITRRSDGAVASAPLPALADLRVDPRGSEVEGRLSGLGSHLEFLITGGTTGRCRLRLECGSGEDLEITVDYDRGRVVIDREQASADPRADRGRCTLDDAVDLAGADGIRGFVDGSILELFLPGGEVATLRFYPTSPPPWQLRVTAAPEVRVVVWELCR